jgi:hypothetical protein
MIDKKMREIDEKEGWNKDKEKGKGKEKISPAIPPFRGSRPNAIRSPSGTLPPPYGPDSPRTAVPPSLGRVSPAVARRRPSSIALASPTRSSPTTPRAASAAGLRHQRSSSTALSSRPSPVQPSQVMSDRESEFWTDPEVGQNDRVVSARLVPDGNKADLSLTEEVTSADDQARPSTDISDSNASSTEELPMSAGKLKPRAARRQREDSSELEQFFREGPPVMPHPPRSTSSQRMRPATSSGARPTGLGEFLQRDHGPTNSSTRAKAEARPASTRSRPDTSGLSEFLRATSPESAFQRSAPKEIGALPRVSRDDGDGSSGSSHHASVTSFNQSSERPGSRRLEARPAAVRARDDDSLVNFLRAGPPGPPPSSTSGGQPPNLLQKRLARPATTSRAAGEDGGKSLAEFLRIGPPPPGPLPRPPKSKRPSTAPSTPREGSPSFASDSASGRTPSEFRRASAPKMEARGPRMDPGRSEDMATLASLLEAGPSSHSRRPDDQTPRGPTTPSGLSASPQQPASRSSPSPEPLASGAVGPVTPSSRRKRWSVLDSVFRPGGPASQRPSTAPGNHVPAFGSSTPDWTPRSSNRGSTNSNSVDDGQQRPNGAEIHPPAPARPPPAPQPELKTRPSTLSSRSEDSRNLAELDKSRAFKRPEGYTPSPNAPLEYVKLARTKKSRMVKAVETKKRTYLAVLCGEAGERIELFTVNKKALLVCLFTPRVLLTRSILRRVPKMCHFRSIGRLFYQRRRGRTCWIFRDSIQGDGILSLGR